MHTYIYIEKNALLNPPLSLNTVSTIILFTQEVLQHFREGLWTCCGCYTVSSDSDLDLFQLVLAPKVHICSQSPSTALGSW